QTALFPKALEAFPRNSIGQPCWLSEKFACLLRTCGAESSTHASFGVGFKLELSSAMKVLGPVTQMIRRPAMLIVPVSAELATLIVPAGNDKNWPDWRL